MMTQGQQRMQRIVALIAGRMENGADAFRHGLLDITFHSWAPGGMLPLMDGPVFAFVDWLLPAMPGIEACRRLRCDPVTASAHIVMVLEDDDRDARRRALAAGADDYLLGPLTRQAALDRILAHQSGGLPPSAPAEIAMGDLVIDIAAFQARWRGVAIPLLPNDFRLLRYFVEHPGRVFTRSQLIAALGKHGEDIDERTVDVWVGRLRRALERAGVRLTIRTVRSLGYVLDRA